jgi:C-terminal processing protease CtpA/Prc
VFSKKIPTQKHQKPENFNLIRIKQVERTSRRRSAELRAGDIITAVNGRPATQLDLDQLSKMFKQAGKQYHLTVSRGEKTISFKFTLARVI